MWVRFSLSSVFGGVVRFSAETTRLAALLRDEVAGFCAGFRISRVNQIISIKSKVTHICKLGRVRTKRVIRFTDNIGKVTLGLRGRGMKVIIFNDSATVGRKSLIGHAKSVISIPTKGTLLKHIISKLKIPVSKEKTLDSRRQEHIRIGTPNVVRHGSIRRPVRAKLGTMSDLIPVNHNRQRLVVKSQRAKGATVTVSAVLGRGRLGSETASRDSALCYICMTVKRGHSAITRLIRVLSRTGTLRCSVLMTTATSSPTPLRFLTPCSKYTVKRCFHSGKVRTLVVCSSLDGRTITCQRVSLLLHQPPNHRTFPNSIFCLRSHLLRETTGQSSRANTNDLATLPIVRARTKSMSTCVPAGIVSVASKRVYSRARLFCHKVEPTVGINLSIDHIKSTTRLGVVGRIYKDSGLRLTRCHRITTFTRFKSSLSTTARTLLGENTELARMPGRPRCTPLPVRGRVLIVCTTIGKFYSQVPLSEVSRCRETVPGDVGPRLLRSLLRGKKLAGREGVRPSTFLGRDTLPFRGWFVLSTRLLVLPSLSFFCPNSGTVLD